MLLIFSSHFFNNDELGILSVTLFSHLAECFPGDCCTGDCCPGDCCSADSNELLSFGKELTLTFNDDADREDPNPESEKSTGGELDP